MKKLMQNDIFLRIFSLALAIFCWIYIVFITNPEIEIKINNISVSLANHQAIKNEGYIVSNEINTTVNIKIKGTRRMLADLDEKSIIAYVDLTDCTDAKTYDLPINIKLPYDGISLVSSDVTKISVDVDKYSTKDIPISYTYSGSLSPHYSINGEPQLANKTVTISGPEPILSTIEKASITINLDNASDDISGFAPITLLNSNNSQVTSSTIDVKNDKISYKCTIYLEKVLPIEPTLSNATKFEGKIQGNNYVTIEGPASKINVITSIPTKTIYMGDTEGLYVTNLNLPEGIIVKEDIQTVSVQVTKK